MHGCQEKHAKHYCKFCKNGDSEHFSRNCPIHCKASGCQEKHAKNYCEICKIIDSDHFFKDYQIHCKVLGCQEKHAKHYCKFCKDVNSKHFSRNCPIRCKVHGCYEKHAKHYCEICKIDDSDHFLNEEWWGIMAISPEASKATAERNPETRDLYLQKAQRQLEEFSVLWTENPLTKELMVDPKFFEHLKRDELQELLEKWKLFNRRAADDMTLVLIDLDAYFKEQ